MKQIAAGVVMLLIYCSLAGYIGWTVFIWLNSFALPVNGWVFAFLWAVLAFSYFIGMLGHKWLGFTIAGSYWLAFFQYALLIVPIANLLVIVIDHPRDVQIAGSLAAALFILIFSIGTFLAYSPVVRKKEFIVKGNGDDLDIVIASDFHLGVLSGKRHLKRFVNLSNKLEPDLVLLAGDLVDDDPIWYARYGMSEVMRKLKSKYGVFGVLGNHEYYGKKIPLLVRVMEESGVVILRDETVEVAGKFNLTGREERTNGKRDPLENLKPAANLPWIVMDHTPSDLKTPVELGVDFHISGHTHKGQMWPNHLITKRVFELNYGYRIKEATHFIVSSGYGFWGPPIRIGSRSELWAVRIKFENI
ncbi:metallophosphoesterase [Planococcus halotolerans]|uniref:metallophosphoesterase n=1 Tax=Planococcus halotolerans TaxID=2233542 RepID=UPI001F182158|nr:metallophosphoesterase [Planococcus halotolerans]